MLKVHPDRPPLERNMALEALDMYYWYMQELVAYCREHGLPTQGHKHEVIERVRQHLRGGPVAAYREPVPAINQCARLVANAIVFYNSAILSRLFGKCLGSGNEKALALVTSTSPVAWRHVHFGGRYALRDGGQSIDLDTIVKGLSLD